MSTVKMNRTPRTVQNVFVLLLLALFALMSAFLVILEAGLYNDTVHAADEHNRSRVLNAVVRNAVWAADEAGSIHIEKQTDGALTALCFTDDFGEDGVYIKRLYCKDGYLWESYTDAERPFEGDAGDPLCEAILFEPALKDGLLTVRLQSPDGAEQELILALRTEVSP